MKYTTFEKLEQELASRDAEIAELKLVSDHNLHAYQEAASKMRAEISESNSRIDSLKDSILLDIEEIATLREHVKMLRVALDVAQNYSMLIKDAAFISEALAATAQKEIQNG